MTPFVIQIMIDPTIGKPKKLKKEELARELRWRLNEFCTKLEDYGYISSELYQDGKVVFDTE